jgi:DNA invertase Pin-like site-specific DNA recombinase
MRAVIYTRVSTGQQAQSGLGLADQLDQATSAAKARGWEIIHHARDAGASAKSMRKRPALQRALAMLDAGEADVLVSAKLDRLSRSCMDFGGLMERARRKGWSIVCLDLGVDTSTPAGEMMANVVMAFAQYERQMIGERTKASHAVRRNRGQRAGQEPILPASVRKRIAKERQQGHTLKAIADGLASDRIPTAKGGNWHPSTVAHVLRSIDVDAELKAKKAK